MKKVFLVLAVLAFMTLRAVDDNSENREARSASSEEQTSNNEARAINTIAEAAISDRDYGKDIGDR